MHKLKFSIHLLEVRNYKFFGNVCFSYDKNPNFELSSFKTNKPIKVLKNSKEIIYFENCFYSTQFNSDTESLIKKLEEEFLEVYMLSVDANKKNKIQGKIIINLLDLKNVKTKKTIESFVKLVDKYYIIEDIKNQNDEVGQKLGEIRVKIYLEDFGTLEYLENLNKSIFENEEENNSQILLENSNIPFKKDYEDIEVKVIWELDNWKKSEESKFKYELKEKEIRFLTNLKQEWNKKEIEKENIFKNYEIKLTNLENKLKNKAVQLQKRENKIILLEEELNQKMNIVSNELSIKDNEINDQKQKELLIKKQLKDKDKKITSLKEKIEIKHQELQSLKEYYEKAPINEYKSKLAEQITLNNNLKNDIKSTEKLKQEYKKYFEEMSLKINNLQEEKKSNDIQIKFLKLQMANNTNISGLKNEFINLNKIQKNTNKSIENSSISSLNSYNNNPNLVNLIKYREELLAGGYDEDDDALIELQKEIDKINDFK